MRGVSWRHVPFHEEGRSGRAGGCAPRPRRADARPRAARRARHAAPAAVPGADGAARRRDGLLLGRRARLLAGRRRLHDGGRLRGRLHAEPDVRGGRAAAAPATPRPCSSSSTRRRSRYDEHPAPLLGEPRPDAGHAPGQRRRHAVPLGDLLGERRAARRPPRRRATCTRQELASAGYGEITTEIARGRAVLLRRGLPPAVPREEPERLLRARRHRRRLPGRAYRRAESFLLIATAFSS